MVNSRLLRAFTSVDAKSCIIEKDTTFTHFASKLLHISASKLVYIFSLATVTAYIYTVIVACLFIILLISVRTNFSLSSPCTTTSTPHLLFLGCTHTNTSTQTNQHRNTPTHKQTNKEIDQCLWSLVCGLAGEEVIWVVELGSWIGQ